MDSTTSLKFQEMDLTEVGSKDYSVLFKGLAHVERSFLLDFLDGHKLLEKVGQKLL
jgi:hypothetical protein